MKSTLLMALVSLGFATGANALTVVDIDGNTVAGATVMIGDAVDSPFPGNVVNTDASGNVPSLTGWKSALPVSIEAKGFVRTTYAGVTPDMTQLALNKEDGQNRLEIKGETVGYGRLRRDGIVDFGLVLPALSRQQMLSFDMSSVVSTEIDVIRVLTMKLGVPSNLSLPKQSENYILPVKFNKPAYRMYVREPGDYNMAVLHGRFPLKKVVDDVRAKKPFTDIIKHFDMVGGGTKDVTVTTNIAGINLPVDQTILDQKMLAKGPAYDTTKAVVLGFSMVEDRGRMIPADFKQLLPGKSVELKKPSNLGSRAMLMSVMSESIDFARGNVDEAVEILEGILNSSLLNESGIHFYAQDDVSAYDGNVDFVLGPSPETQAGQVSISIQAENALGSAPAFMPLVAAPQVANGIITLVAPDNKNTKLNSFGTVVVFSEIEKIDNGEYTTEIKTRLWEVVANDWTSQIQLPDMAPLKKAGKFYRWEVMYLGSDTHKRNLDTHILEQLDDITHVTRNAVDLK